MTDHLPEYGQQVTSNLSQDGQLTLELRTASIPKPGPDNVVIRVEASPINPSDLMTMIPVIDPSNAQFDRNSAGPRVCAQLPKEAAEHFTNRFDQPLTIGLEGAGTVVAAGDNARHLLGKKVAALTLSRGMFAQYCTLNSAECIPLPEGVSSAEGAALFCNPMTALAIAETARLDGHKALIHTAAASSLGQMLVKICQQDSVPLVNIVRRQAQVELLQELGATYVCNSSSPTFAQDLLDAVKATGATVAFDAVGGGNMPHHLLAAMESAAVARMPEYSPYGSTELKSVHVYGRLDKSPVELDHSGYGMLWSIGGWAMPPLLERVGPERNAELIQRVITNLTTTFATRYAREISLSEALQRDNMVAYYQQATGGKYLINPTL